MKRRSIKMQMICLLMIVAGSLLVACGRQVAELPAVEMRVVKDDLGREVRLPVKVTRAVSLAPSITEMVFAAGAGDR
ncbi:MAG TPA: cobalamin-binding protein, partial [Blastocatellia bacterium]|nr:cobalamin-binding protein [Blastocatellia bacterium]